jgi:hypothetical protein
MKRLMAHELSHSLVGKFSNMSDFRLTCGLTKDLRGTQKRYFWKIYMENHSI